jgi:hypothetical protein
MTSKRNGYVKGEPYKFICGHYRRRGRPPTYTVEPETGCWLWDRALHKGYGRIRAYGKVVYAHRFFYEKHVGPIPDGLVLDHLCRNRACVNPGHLQPVSRMENNRRGARAKLRPEDARLIRRTLNELADRFDISMSTILNIARGESWR